jgi:hypothetical protein
MASQGPHARQVPQTLADCPWECQGNCHECARDRELSAAHGANWYDSQTTSERPRPAEVVTPVAALSFDACIKACREGWRWMGAMER